jgi:putative component of toxin-antitoxin plasmid stabilization module
MLEVLKSTTFETWFNGLRDIRAQMRISARIRRLSLGNVFGVLLCGGDKRT